MHSPLEIDKLLKNLPRLTPTWHGIENSKLPGDSQHFIDFGGSGVDVVFEENELKCLETKHLIDQCHYRASSCTLPFLPANKVANENDPCLTLLHEAKEKLKNFTSSLRRVRICFNQKNTAKFKNSVLLTHKVLSKMSKEKNFENSVVPLSIAQLALDFPEKAVLPPINMSYAGGCLATSCSSGGNSMLLHPSGEKLNHLEITIIEEAKEFNKHFRPIPSIEKSSVKLKGGIIFQVSSSIEGYSYVRQKKSCHFINFSNVYDVSHSRLIEERELTYIASSPYNPEDYIVIYDDGRLELKYLDHSEPAWVLNLNQYGEINYPQCNFGSHPMSILCLDEKEFCSFDIRLQQDIRKVLFSNLCDTFFIDEKLISHKNSVGNYFQHVVLSNYHLFVCDERYPKKPVLIYDHMLSSYPLYCDAATLSTSQDFSDVMIFVATQDSRELSTFFVRTQHSRVQPISLSPPLHLSSATDCVDSLQLHCIPVKDSLMQRLTYPIVGVTIAPHSSESGFTAFQLNSLGDLFYQDFTKSPSQEVEKNYKVGLGCVLTPPDKISTHLAQFSHNLPESKEECNEFIHPLSSELNIDLTKLFSAMKNISVYCDVCNSDKDNTLICEEESQNRLCPSCNFTKEQGEIFSNALQNLSLLSGSSNSTSMVDFDNSSFYEFDDSLSKKLLTMWDNNIVESKVMDSDYSSFVLTPSSSCSSPSSSVSMPDLNSSASIPPEVDIAKMLFEDVYSFNSPQTGFQFDSLESMDNFVPPSQEIQPLVGETLRRIKKRKPTPTTFGSGGF